MELFHNYDASLVISSLPSGNVRSSEKQDEPKGEWYGSILWRDRDNNWKNGQKRYKSNQHNVKANVFFHENHLILKIFCSLMPQNWMLKGFFENPVLRIKGSWRTIYAPAVCHEKHHFSETQRNKSPSQIVV